jgi:hypothetical protein
MSVELSLLNPRRIAHTSIAQCGGWFVELGCEHTVWSEIAPQKPMICGICAQQAIRQIHRVIAAQAPPPYRKRCSES